MTDCNKLAQRIVAQGIGKARKIESGHHKFNVYSGDQSAEKFCHDWRVVGALMEKAGPGSWAGRVKFSATVNLHKAHADSLPIAIALACLDALENSSVSTDETGTPTEFVDTGWENSNDS